METNEVYSRFKKAQQRFYDELYSIQREYISSHYNFKEGDVIMFQNYSYKNPTLIVIDSIYFNNSGNYAEEANYKNPVIKISGHMVDEDGYDKTYFRDSNQTISVGLYAEDVKKKTDIKPKGLRR